MTATNGYCTDAELKAWLQIPDTDDDSIVTRAINAASRWIDGYTNRKFWLDPTAVARTFTASDGYTLIVDDIGAVSPTVKIDSAGDGTFETTLAASDVVLLPENAIAQGKPAWQIAAVGSYTFPVAYPGLARRARVEVTAKWGWPSVPEDVAQACLIQASRYVKRRQSPEGVAGFGDFGVVRLTADRDVADLLDQYRLVTVA